jgi:hypothetical protein
MVQLFKDAGPMGLLNILAGAFGLFVAFGTVAMMVMKSKAANVGAVLSLLCALGVLGIGFAGYKMGMNATLGALDTVPQAQQHLLLEKGTAEAGANLVIALFAALAPLVAGTVAAARSRFKAGLGLGAIAVVAYVATLIGAS